MLCSPYNAVRKLQSVARLGDSYLYTNFCVVKRTFKYNTHIFYFIYKLYKVFGIYFRINRSKAKRESTVLENVMYNEEMIPSTRNPRFSIVSFKINVILVETRED